MTEETFHPYKVSAVHTTHLALRVKWHESSDWLIPQSYGDPEREAREASAAVGLQDISDIGKLDLKGSGVEPAISGLTSVDVLAVLRIKPGHALVITQPNAAPAVRESLAAASSMPLRCLHLTDVTSALTAVALVGPRADDVLSRLTALDLRLKRFPEKSCAQCDLAKVHAMIVREMWGAMPAYVILVGREVGEYVWTAIATAGKKLQLTPIGTTAAQLLGGPSIKRDASVGGSVRKIPVVNAT